MKLSVKTCHRCSMEEINNQFVVLVWLCFISSSTFLSILKVATSKKLVWIWCMEKRSCLWKSMQWPCKSSDLNTLNPKSNWHQISPYIVTPESHIKVMRIKEVITNQISFWLVNKFSLSIPQEMYKEQYGEYAYWF